MARVELRRDLNTVTARMVAPTVHRLAQEVADHARRRAPNAKVWLSREDERVRPSHVRAHGQTIPDNLRFQLTRQRVKKDGTAKLTQGFDLARRPRDPSLPPDQKLRCRCVMVTVVGAISRRIVVSPPQISAGRVTSRVSVRFTRIAESEFGGDGDKAARFMGAALDQVASRLRTRRR